MIVRRNHKLSPNRLLALLLAAWCLINILQAAWTELADDEAYYWFYSWHLDWGYYDHPPMVALLVRLTSWIPGELGIRLAALLLQPFGLYLFWTLIRPSAPTRREAALYALICFSFPLLQLYGLLALPDAPLLFFTAVFLWAFQRFSRQDSIAHALLLAVAMALLVYSKYHGVLVILFALASRPALFRSPRLYLAGVLALLLFAPHLAWQYAHNFASFQYHLVGRVTDTGLVFSHIVPFFINLLVVLNPLWIWHCGKQLGARPDAADADIRPTIRFVCFGFVVFFFLSSFREPTQPQWLLPIIYALVAALFDAARRSDSARRYIRTAAAVCAMLFLILRVIVIANPFHFHGQLWDNRADNQVIAQLAGGRPVVFSHNYAASAKYTFYTGQPACTQALLYDRTSQWEYSDLDETFTGQTVVVSVHDNLLADTLGLPSGRRFEYLLMPHFKPLKKVRIKADPLCVRTSATDTVHMHLHITNPYPYDLCSTAESPMQITFIYRITQRRQPETDIPLADTLRAGATTDVCLAVPARRLPDSGSFRCGFSLRHKQYRSCLSSAPMQLSAQRDADSISITLQP